MRKKSLLLLLAFFVFLSFTHAQQRNVIGKIISNIDNEPIPGVSVLIQTPEGATTGSITDLNGSFSILVPGNDVELVFSFIGYVTQRRLVGTRSEFNVTLQEEVSLLGEVVVVGYGEQNRKTLTSSISSVSAKDIENLPMPSADQMMQGRAAGVLVSSNSGTPGGGVSVRVRGQCH
jgi:hypothetical protein